MFSTNPLKITTMLHTKIKKKCKRKRTWGREIKKHFYPVAVQYNFQLEPCAHLRCKLSVAQLMAYSSHLMLLHWQAELHLWKGMDYDGFTLVAQTQRGLLELRQEEKAKQLNPPLPLSLSIALAWESDAQITSCKLL